MTEALPQRQSAARTRLHWKTMAGLLCGALAVLSVWGMEPVCVDLNPKIGVIFFFLFVIAALYLGHRSRRDIRRHSDQLKGTMIAFVSLILSYALLLGGFSSYLLRPMVWSRRWTSECAAVVYMRRIVHAEDSYASKGRGYASLAELVNADLLDPRFNAPVQDYQFSVTASSSEYTASAEPLFSSSGIGYYTAQDGIVRYSTTMTMAPAGQAGQPVH